MVTAHGENHSRTTGSGAPDLGEYPEINRILTSHMYYTTGIVLAFFLCLLLLGKKHKTLADYLLACWLFWIGCHLWLYYLYITEKIFELPVVLGVSIPMPLAHPLFLFLYTTALCRGRLSRYWWVHTLPILACYLYLIPFCLRPDDQKIWVFKNKGSGYEGFLFAINIAIISSGILYTFFAQRLLLKHRRVITHLFSNQEKINLQWLQNLIYGLAFIWVAVLFGNDSIVYGAAVIFVLFIGYFGIRQAGIFTSPSAIQLAQTEYESQDPESGILEKSGLVIPGFADTTEPADKKKYEKSGLNREAAETLQGQLQNLMAQEELYKEPELSLTDLAERLETHPNYLSQIINEKEGKNFYDYVNSMRIDAFLKMAADPQNRRFTLFALALECGFNSKSAFNRYFKKATGRSPTEYLNE